MKCSDLIGSEGGRKRSGRASPTSLLSGYGGGGAAACLSRLRQTRHQTNIIPVPSNSAAPTPTPTPTPMATLWLSELDGLLEAGEGAKDEKLDCVEVTR